MEAKQPTCAFTPSNNSDARICQTCTVNRIQSSNTSFCMTNRKCALNNVVADTNVTKKLSKAIPSIQYQALTASSLLETSLGTGSLRCNVVPLIYLPFLLNHFYMKTKATCTAQTSGSISQRACTTALSATKHSVRVYETPVRCIPCGGEDGWETTYEKAIMGSLSE